MSEEETYLAYIMAEQEFCDCMARIYAVTKQRNWWLARIMGRVV